MLTGEYAEFIRVNWARHLGDSSLLNPEGNLTFCITCYLHALVFPLSPVPAFWTLPCGVCVVGFLFLLYELTEKACSPFPSLTCDQYQYDSRAAA